MSRRRVLEIEEEDDINQLTEQFRKSVNRQRSPPKFSFESQKIHEVMTYTPKLINNKVIVTYDIEKIEMIREQLEKVLGKFLINKVKYYNGDAHILQFMDNTRTYRDVIQIYSQKYYDGYQKNLILNVERDERDVTITQMLPGNDEEILIENGKVIDSNWQFTSEDYHNGLEFEIDSEEYAVFTLSYSEEATMPRGLLIITNRSIKNYNATKPEVTLEAINFNNKMGVNILSNNNKDTLTIILEDLSHIYEIRIDSIGYYSHFKIEELDITKKNSKFLLLKSDEDDEKIFDIEEMKFYNIMTHKKLIKVVDENNIELPLTKRMKIMDFIGEEMNFD